MTCRYSALPQFTATRLPHRYYPILEALGIEESEILDFETTRLRLMKTALTCC